MRSNEEMEGSESERKEARKSSFGCWNVNCACVCVAVRKEARWGRREKK